MIEFTGAIKVSVGTITSSFFLTFKTLKATCNAEVPFMQATAYLEPKYEAIFFSKIDIK